MLWLPILILALVEGLTEFLPISSTGHLVVAARLLSFDPAWREPFLVVIQLGAIMAVLVDRRREIWSLLTATRAQTIDLVIKLALGFLPSATLGFLFHDAISALLESPVGVSLAWIVGGIAILLLDRGDTNTGDRTVRLLDITRRQALLVGCAQILALWPGMSRSGSTIIGGLAVKLDRPTATLFSFYLAIPTMFAASGYELLKFRDQLSGTGPSFLFGMTIAFFVAWATIRWLLRFVAGHTFRGFAIYRIVAGLLLLVLPKDLVIE